MEFVLAVGAHLKNTIALSVGPQVFISQHIGDLETDQACEAFRRVIADFQTLYESRPAHHRRRRPPRLPLHQVRPRPRVIGRSSQPSTLSPQPSTHQRPTSRRPRPVLHGRE